MNERDFTNDLLTTKKSMTDSYKIYLDEASHQSIDQDILNIYTKQNEQRQLYILCSERAG